MRDNNNNLHELTATEIVARTKAGTLRVEDYARALLAHIDATEPALRAWVVYDPQRVLAEARALDQLPPARRGPLHGVAVAVKDIFLTRDYPTAYGSAFPGHTAPPGIDATAVAVLRGAGALIVGKTTSTQFAASTHGPATVNAADSARTPGGSSSGSAAAVAALHVPLALGTQTGGSIIRPASFNGVWGLKPTWNAISRDGVKIYSLTCDTVGVFARSAADVALAAGVFGLSEPGEPPAPSTLRLAAVRTAAWEHATPATEAALSRAIALLTKAGVTVEEVELEALAEAAGDENTQWHDTERYRAVIHPEGARAFWPDYYTFPEGERAAERGQRLESDVVEQIEDGLRRGDEAHLAALDTYARLRARFGALTAGYDAVITPSTTGYAPLLDETRHTGNSVFCTLWTVLHVPVVNVPGLTEDGLPVGISLVGRRYEDAQLLRVAEAVGQVFARDA